VPTLNHDYEERICYLTSQTLLMRPTGTLMDMQLAIDRLDANTPSEQRSEILDSVRAMIEQHSGHILVN